MKYSLLLFALTIGIMLKAQEVPAPITNDPVEQELSQDLERERTALSGSLKDMLGQVHDKLGTIETSIQQPTTDKSNDVLAQQRILLNEAKEDLGSALASVSSADRLEWEMTKKDAEDVISSVKELLDKIGTTTSAVN